MQPLWNTVCRFLKKLKIELFDPAISLWVYIKKKKKKDYFKRCMHPEFIAAPFTIVKKKQPKWPSTDEWVKKTW